jgi:hypothetical protein
MPLWPIPFEALAQKTNAPAGTDVKLMLAGGALRDAILVPLVKDIAANAWRGRISGAAMALPVRMSALRRIIIIRTDN